MSYRGIAVYVDATTIAQEMASDTELAYQVLQELTTILSDNKDEAQFTDTVSEMIFEEEADNILILFEGIINLVNHLKEYSERIQ